MTARYPESIEKCHERIAELENERDDSHSQRRYADAALAKANQKIRALTTELEQVYTQLEQEIRRQ